MGHYSFVYSEPCGEYTVVTLGLVDTGTKYVYDANTRQLVAVLWYGEAVVTPCAGGPAQLTIADCRVRSFFCM
jgi:hypothetical protein